MNKLGIIDWGIGGVSIYKLIKMRLGSVPLVYFSDTGATPYGKMSRPELISRLETVIEYIVSCGVTHVVIGCNAASTALSKLVFPDITIVGVIAPAVSMTARLEPRGLGLIGGRRTVVSGVYRRAFAEKGIKVKQRIAQPLSGLIESGDVTSEMLRTECKHILAPLKNSSHILLACTHYPAITTVLREFVSPDTIFIDPAAELVDIVEGFDLAIDGKDTFLTTGDPAAMKNAACEVFGVTLDKVSSICL